MQQRIIEMALEGIAEKGQEVKIEKWHGQVRAGFKPVTTGKKVKGLGDMKMPKVP